MQRKSFFRFISLFVLISLVISINPVAYITVLAAPAQATTDFTFTPVADTYVNSLRSKLNYGSSTSLKTDASPVVDSYLRFSVQGLSGQLSQARLMIYANSSSARGLAAQAVANNNWGETTLNYSNAPALGNILASSPSVSGGTWVTLDVTSYITGNGTFSFGVTTPGSTAISLGSRESGANSPKLIVSTSVSSTPAVISTPTTLNTATPVVTSLSPSPTATVVSKFTPTVIPPSPTATAATVVIPPSPTATFTRTPAIAPTNTSTPSSTPATNVAYRTWYVDNSVLVNGDGSSWDKSWKSFSLINWNTINPGDTIYISGGSNSQIYNETLTIGKSGSSGKYINIDVGANSPSPLGHDGTVIIDGGGVRQSGIYSYGMSYININGRDSGDNYKLLVRNAVTISDGDANVLIRNGDHINVDYVKIICNTSRGIFFFYMTNGRLRGNDIRTGAVNNSYQTDNIYVGRGFDNVVENNILYNTNAIATESHNDPIQVGNEGRLIVRNNYVESTYDADSIIIGDATDWIYVYNNVAISNIRQLYASPVLIYAGGATGAIYFLNNTIVSSNYNDGHGIELYQGSDSAIGAIKNNIIYTTNEDGIRSDYPITTSSKIDNNCYYNAGGLYASDINSTSRTWAQHQAAGYDVHGINANPLFINNFADLHLQSGSPCRNIGADLSAYFSTDIGGVIRHVGAWDAGAYQYQP